MVARRFPHTGGKQGGVRTLDVLVNNAGTVMGCLRRNSDLAHISVRHRTRNARR